MIDGLSLLGWRLNVRMLVCNVGCDVASGVLSFYLDFIILFLTKFFFSLKLAVCSQLCCAIFISLTRCDQLALQRASLSIFFPLHDKWTTWDDLLVKCGRKSQASF